MGIDDWGFCQAFRASIERQLWEKAARHELGAGLDGGADPTTLFKHDKFFEKGACMQPEACCWQRLQRRAGRRSDDIEQGWWNRRWARDARKRTRTCIIVCGNVEPTQVRSLTRHGISFQEPAKPKTRWNASGSGVCATILDFARHEVGFLASIWEWRIDRSLHIHLLGRLGNAQRPANQARGVGCSHCSGCVKLSWANLGMLEAA